MISAETASKEYTMKSENEYSVVGNSLTSSLGGGSGYSSWPEDQLL
jgi:hypothetical protein